MINPTIGPKSKTSSGKTTNDPSCSAARGSLVRLLTMIPTLTAMIVSNGASTNMAINHIGSTKKAKTRSLAARKRALKKLKASV